MSKAVPHKIKVMVSSTVFGYESDLVQICAELEGYGYQVLNNFHGTIYIPPGVSNTEACLRAVDDCDFFFGIIRPRYGSGITHQEFQRAIARDKPRGFLAHYSVPFARQLLAQYMYTDEKKRIKDPAFTFKKTSVLEDIRVIDMYNEAIQDAQPMDKRRWAHEFVHFPRDGMRFVKTEFEDYERMKADLELLKQPKK